MSHRLSMDLDEIVDTSDVEEREFDASEPDYYSSFTTDKTPSNSGRATGRSIVRREGQPSPRKRVKITHSKPESHFIVDLSTLSHPLVLTPIQSAQHESIPHTSMRLAINPISELLPQAPHTHELSHNRNEEPNFDVPIEPNSPGVTDSGDPLFHKDHPITLPVLQARAQEDPQSPLPDSSQPQLDNALFPSSPTSMTSTPPTLRLDHGGAPQTLDFPQTPVSRAPSQLEGDSSSPPSRSRPADSWSLFSSPPGPSTQSSQGLAQQSFLKSPHGIRDSSPLTPHPTDRRSQSPDELLLISPVPRARHLPSPAVPRSRESSSPALSSHRRSLPPTPPPAIPSPHLVIPEDTEPLNRYSLRRRQARQLQPYAYDKALYKAQMKANPDAIVRFVNSQRHEMHAEDGSQWEDGQTQGDTQTEYIFPVDNQDKDYVQVEERRGRRRAEADRYDHEQDGGWLPEALKDLSDSDEMEGADEVRKEAREMKRARKKAEAEAKKREKEEARLKAQEEAAKRAEAGGTATKRHLKHFPLAGAPSSNQPAVGPSSTSPRRSPTHLDERSPPVLSRLVKGKQRAVLSSSRSPSPLHSRATGASQHQPSSLTRTPPVADEYEYHQDDDYDYHNHFDDNDNFAGPENVHLDTDNDVIEIPSASPTPPLSSSTLPDGDDHLHLSDDHDESRSLSPELSSKDRKRLRLLQRMMPAVMIKKQIQQKGSQMNIPTGTKRVRSPTPSDRSDEPLKPGHARVRMGAGQRDIQGDPESSDVEIPDNGGVDVDVDVPEIVPHLHRRKSPKLQSRFRSRSPVISLTSGSNTEDGDSDSDGGDSESDGMIDDARIDAWSRSRRPTQEKSLIDWMLTRTRTVGGGRKKRSNSVRRSRGSGVKSREMGESRAGQSRPKLNIVTGGTRTGKQTLLSFPVISSEHDRRPHHSHHNEVHRRTEPTILTEHEAKAPRKQRRKKKRKQTDGDLYSFHRSGTHIARRGLTIDLRDEGFHQALDPTWRTEMDRWQKKPGLTWQHAATGSSQAHRGDAQSKRRIPFSRVNSQPGATSSQDERQRTAQFRPQRPLSRVDSRRSHVEFDMPPDPLRDPTPPVRRKAYNDVHDFIHATNQRTLLTTVDLGIGFLPSGITFSPETYIGRGSLHQLICLVTGQAQPVAPLPCVVRGFDLGPDTSVHILTTILAPLCDQFADDVLKSNEWTAAAAKDLDVMMRTVCQLVSWQSISIDDQEFSSLELTVHETVGSLVARVLETDLHHFSLTACWFAVELAARVTHAARTRRGSSESRELFKFALLLMRPLSDVDIRETLASCQELDDPLETTSIPVQALESWICLFHLLTNCPFETPSQPSSEPFWLLFKQLIQDEAPSFTTAVEASEYAWRNMFSFCALSQFSAHGLSTSLSRIAPSWETVLATLKLISLVADLQKDALSHTVSLNKRDEYVSVVASRCFLLWKRWHWSLNDAMIMFNHLVEIFRSRKFASLRHEQPKFMQFMMQRDISLLSIQDRGDNVFEVLLKMIVQVAQVNGTSDAGKKHRDIQVKKMLNMVVPVGSVSSMRAVQPTGQESSMLFNRLNAMAVAIYLDPSISNARHRIGQARRCVNFKEAHDYTRAVCIRGIEHICAVMRHHNVQLGDILSWLAEVTGILLDEYQEARTLTSKDNNNIVKNKTVEMIKSLLTSVVRMIETASLDIQEKRHEYPDPAFLEGPWVKDIFNPRNPIAIEDDSSAACQEVVQAFLDARMRALPRPSAPAISPTVDNQESQDEYDKFFIDLNDPEILAALGNEPAQASGTEWKGKEEAVCKLCGPLASSLFRVVCRYVVDSPAPSRIESRRETADRWIDCWVGVGNVLVQNGSSWNNHMHLGPESWERIPDPLWRRRVGLRFCFALLKLDSKAYSAYEDYFIEILLMGAVPFKTTIEHEYTSIVLTLDGLRHPLLRGVMVEPSAGSSTFEISLEEFSTIRQTLIESVFANLAERLHDNMDLVDHKYLGFVVSMLSAMRDNYESLLSEEERATYAEFCRKVFRALLSSKPLASQPRLSQLIQWGKITMIREGDGDGDGDQPMDS